MVCGYRPVILCVPVYTSYISYIGHEDCKLPYDVLDLQFCKQYTTHKPAPARIEFLELADILLEENNWYIHSHK